MCIDSNDPRRKKKMLILVETIGWTWTMFFGVQLKFSYKFNYVFVPQKY